MGASSEEAADIEMESESAQATQDTDVGFVGFVGSLEPMQDDEIAEMLESTVRPGSRRRSERAGGTTSFPASRSTSRS